MWPNEVTRATEMLWDTKVLSFKVKAIRDFYRFVVMLATNMYGAECWALIKKNKIRVK